VSNALIDLLQPVANRLHTITADNGKEFAEHEKVAHELQVDFLFAHPNAAWERGAKENMNGLVRQNIPKKCNFASVTDDELIHVIKRLNYRPRKCLAFMSPFEVFFDQAVALTS
jgi:IS30 family transposase